MASVKYLPFLLLLGLSSKAQTFGEWFQQTKTQKQYLQQQVMALNAFETELKAGYAIAHHGLSNISAYNASEYQLHQSYYTGLKNPGKTVKNNPQVYEIVGYQEDINNTLRRLPASEYTNQVKAAVLQDCDQQLTALQQVLSANGMQMSDADRLKKINAIHAAMLSNYHFVSRFAYQNVLLQNDHASQDIQTLRNLYESH